MKSAEWNRKIAAILKHAREDGRQVLLETEGMEILQALGISTPQSLFARSAEEAHKLDLSRIAGEKVVLKVVSKDILHKTELGGVRVLAKETGEIVSAIREMHTRLSGDFEITGYTVNEKVSFPAGFGTELLLSLRFTEDFGPILTVGSGGTNAEFLGAALKPREATAIVDPKATANGNPLSDTLRNVAAVRYAALPQRGQQPLIRLEAIEAVLKELSELAREFGPELADFEVNPFVITSDSPARLVALDALVKLRTPSEAATKPRPIEKIRNLLIPSSIAIMGVSEKINPGRIILKNVLGQGFPRENIFVVKPGAESIDGCRCVPDVASLPRAVDTLVLAVSAAQAADALTQAIESRKAESVILIPGGLEEKSGNEALVARMKASLAKSRATEWRGPVINGGNCLGIRSVPGKINTFFIPEAKLPLSTGAADPLAMISQSGAFSISRLSKMASINPKYTLSIGNQMDLSAADYLEYLKSDPELQVFAVYMEGFKPLDGRRFLDVAREIADSGRPIILYTAGRTAAGAAASASHTASIAGNWEVTRQLCAAAGILYADTLDEFEDLTRLALRLRDTRFDSSAGRRPGAALGAISNAGFECVGFADNLGHLWCPELSAATVTRLSAVLDKARISALVDIHNPLDVTPMADDAAYEESVKALLDDPSVDCVVIGCVPLTGALRHDPKIPDSTPQRLAALRRSSRKPFITVIDSGAIYDEMADHLESSNIPVFRTADRALKILDRYASWRLKYARGARSAR